MVGKGMLHSKGMLPMQGVGNMAAKGMAGLTASGLETTRGVMSKTKKGMGDMSAKTMATIGFGRRSWRQKICEVFCGFGDEFRKIEAMAEDQMELEALAKLPDVYKVSHVVCYVVLTMPP